MDREQLQGRLMGAAEKVIHDAEQEAAKLEGTLVIPGLEGGIDPGPIEYAKGVWDTVRSLQLGMPYGRLNRMVADSPVVQDSEIPFAKPEELRLIGGTDVV